MGIPTKIKKENEVYLDKFKMYVSGFDSSDYKIEWMRILPESKLPIIVKTVPHIAFEVKNLKKVLKGKKVIIEPNQPSPDFMVAFIEENGAPIEFIQKIKKPIV